VPWLALLAWVAVVRQNLCVPVASLDKVSPMLTWPEGPHLRRSVTISPIVGTHWQRVLELASRLSRDVPERPLVIDAGVLDCHTGNPPRRFTSSRPPE
jgi:hypothetical protein